MRRNIKTAEGFTDRINSLAGCALGRLLALYVRSLLAHGNSGSTEGQLGQFWSENIFGGLIFFQRVYINQKWNSLHKKCTIGMNIMANQTTVIIPLPSILPFVPAPRHGFFIPMDHIGVAWAHTCRPEWARHRELLPYPFSPLPALPVHFSLHGLCFSIFSQTCFFTKPTHLHVCSQASILHQIILY